MRTKGWRFHARRTGWDGLTLYTRKDDTDIVGVTLDVRTPNSLEDKPLFKDTQEDIEDGVGDAMNFLRAALNCAWDLGLRPDGFNDTRESMAATKTHLEDMRALVFGRDKPK